MILDHRSGPSESAEDTEEAWDTPLQQGKFLLQKTDKCYMKGKFIQTVILKQTFIKFIAYLASGFSNSSILNSNKYAVLAAMLQI
jgi:hypothetical protein